MSAWYSPGTPAHDVLDVIARAGYRLSRVEIVEETGRDPKAVHSLLQRLLRRGMLLRQRWIRAENGRGTWGYRYGLTIWGWEVYRGQATAGRPGNGRKRVAR